MSVRDTRRSKEYFDKFITNDKRRISKFETELEAGFYPPDRVPSIKDYVHMLWTEVTIARYSRGDDLDKLKADYLAQLEKYWDWADTSAYDDNIRSVSLAYLLGAYDEMLGKIKQRIHNENVKKSFDAITDFILTGDRSLVGIGKLAWPKSPARCLEQAIKENSAEAVKTYLSRWYASNRSSGWGDTHKNEKEYLYFGYWAFEAAAIGKRLGISDISFRGNVYYPKDLV